MRLTRRSQGIPASFLNGVTHNVIRMKASAHQPVEWVMYSTGLAPSLLRKPCQTRCPSGTRQATDTATLIQGINSGLGCFKIQI